MFTARPVWSSNIFMLNAHRRIQFVRCIKHTPQPAKAARSISKTTPKTATELKLFQWVADNGRSSHNPLAFAGYVKLFK